MSPMHVTLKAGVMARDSMFSYYVTVTILVSQKREMAAMLRLVSATNPDVNNFFSFNSFALLLAA